MRADRLLSMLMLLQARGKMTADALAAELGVSVRTIYRDADALEVSGVPITTERGPGGGIALLDSYRSTLTGLTESEVRALSMLTVPAALAELGVKSDLQRALRKLSASMPLSRQNDDRRIRQRIHLDATPWQHRAESNISLQVVQGALWEDRCLAIRYELAWGAAQARTILPLGLVAKSNRWHLVCTWGAGPRVVKMASLIAARPCDPPRASTLVRPPAFDLPAFWSDWCGRSEQNRSAFVATVRVTTDLYDAFRYLDPGGEIETMSPPDANGWLTIRITEDSFEAARSHILAWGGAATVVEPQALRESVLDFAVQTVDAYASH